MLFAVAQAGSADTPAKKPPSPFVKDRVVLIKDQKRATNLAIQLAALKRTPTEVHRQLLECDLNILTPDVLNLLLQCAPKPEEDSAVRQYEGDPSKLGEADRFFYEMKDIPRLQGRIEAMLFSLTCEATLAKIHTEIKALNTACEALRSSEPLRQLLLHVLAVGNRVNANTARGRAAGFTMESLLKLADVRARDRSTTLLDFVVMEMQRHGNDAAAVSSSLESVPAAARLDLAALKSRLEEVEKGCRDLSHEVKQFKKNPAPNDKFGVVMEAFSGKMNQLCKEAKDAYHDALGHYVDLSTYFGEHITLTNVELMKQPLIFITLREFSFMLLRARTAIEEKQRKEAMEKLKQQGGNSPEHSFGRRRNTSAVDLGLMSGPLRAPPKWKHEHGRPLPRQRTADFEGLGPKPALGRLPSLKRVRASDPGGGVRLAGAPSSAPDGEGSDQVSELPVWVEQVPDVPASRYFSGPVTSWKVPELELRAKEEGMRKKKFYERQKSFSAPSSPKEQNRPSSGTLMDVAESPENTTPPARRTTGRTLDAVAAALKTVAASTANRPPPTPPDIARPSADDFFRDDPEDDPSRPSAHDIFLLSQMKQKEAHTSPRQQPPAASTSAAHAKPRGGIPLPGMSNEGGHGNHGLKFFRRKSRKDHHYDAEGSGREANGGHGKDGHEESNGGHGEHTGSPRHEHRKSLSAIVKNLFKSSLKLKPHGEQGGETRVDGEDVDPDVSSHNFKHSVKFHRRPISFSGPLLFQRATSWKHG